MEAVKYLTKEEFIQKFKLQFSLALKDNFVMDSWENFARTSRELRSQAIKELRDNGYPPKVRAKYNNSIQNYAQPSHRKYLFYKNPICGICGSRIGKLMDATIDHIYPISLGGDNALYNKQIAHGPCNVKKSNKIGEKWKNSM